MTDYYETLGVSRDAGTDDIKRAFRRLARESHPDSNPGDPTAEERFRRIAEAYEVLSDPQRRAAYDRGDRIDMTGLFSSFAGVEDLLSRFFGSGLGSFGGGTAGPAQGRDVGVRVTITLAEAAGGVDREVGFRAPVACPVCFGSGSAPGADLATCDRCAGQGSIRLTRQTLLGAAMSIVPCNRCRGRGKLVVEACERCDGRGAVDEDVMVTVHVPAGIEDGGRLRMPGRGAAGEAGSRAGDLYVEVQVEADPRFVRHGSDLVHRVRLGIAAAALGVDVAVPTVDGENVDITIPAGTQPGTVFKLSRHGMPRLRSRGRGDLLVEVIVEIPSSLTREQEEALRAFAAAGESPTAPGKRRRRGG
ncbi:MAG TPA: molecular chaperone DnaJ [Acidimicrobiia bacterium]|nr:molecular chaperone DnaJ [Acidimicrobiia bacterium]